MTSLKKVKKEIVKKCCKYCRSTENLTIDHKVPLVQGGSNAMSNLQVLCKHCNGIKSGLSDRQVRHLFKWFLKIQQSRVEHGRKPYKLK